MGKGCLELVKEYELEVYLYKAGIRTADGKSKAIVGKVTVEVSFKNQKDSITLFLVPSLEQSLYLGIDFWRKFKIAPNIVSSDSFTETEEIETNVHRLSPDEQLSLEAVKQKFLDFDRHGLGKTALMEHVIDTGDAEPVKQRHYPVSPAVQTLLYQEVDRMLELGVIESESPWCSPVVLIKKPGIDGTISTVFAWILEKSMR